MAKFKFRLQNYLNIKEKLEDQKRNEYGQAVSVLDRENQKKSAIQQEKADNIEEFRSRVGSKIDPVSFQGYNLYIGVLERKETEQKKIVLEAEREVEKKRLELVEKMRDRKTIETLKEKDYENYINEEKLAEQKQVDEIVSYKFGKERLEHKN